MLSNFFSYIIQGTAITIAVTLIALPFGLILGLSMALVHTYGGKILNRLAAIFSLLMRGVPPIVLLFILYFMLSSRSFNLSPFWAGSLSLGIVSSAYQMEILRGALLAVGGGQMTAARAIGMSRLQAIQNIILPQALRLAIPPWSNEASIVLKDSSLVYALGVPEILRRAQQLSATTQQPFLAYGIAALIYFVLVFATNRALDYLAERTKLPTHP
ncbi:amino acid ABC transporter permease [Candidatus Villigracilis affinis]|jgi:polar amino acid transport system permease protein|uniref:amino acid ABC transporter permease n=1 Tax=Candidatus Villigracilis affinis TaxID=3140682 RepID=UPI001D34A3E7|nr:amino acid ABC transporter permease [Anaerolineales bacterium]